ncbi:glyoxalase [Gordonia sp. NB41Y]|uniref:glyoxalase n=1 Tax=Gordonia sp. NB41Y TaxID=875808 RepID=UPI0006B19BC1|nr:glyoxalase [Gordonia sp. NB41Y]KOY49214.1 glyoxalase [Gordonia sp. NB41Y]WLP92429.1 glyoxalase [Gordonia sp. NB41Y]
MTTSLTSALDSLSLGVPDVDAARSFYDAAFGLDDRLRLHESNAPTSGFRGFSISLVVAEPAVVDSFLIPAIEAGAAPLKPASKSFWGYGGVVRAPDGAIWKVAASSKKNTGAPLRRVDDVVLLVGAADVAASREFYTGHGFAVAKGFGRKYVEFAAQDDAVKLALYGRKAAAKDAGVSADGSGDHRLVLGWTAGAAATDPDGFVLQAG